MKKLVFLGAFLFGVLSGNSEVRLLTGDSNNNLHNADGGIADISSDGSLILFSSGPPVTGQGTTPGITRGGLYLRDLANDTLTFVGVPIGGESNNNPTDAVEASLSDDGRYFAWRSTAFKVFWRDHQSGVTRAVTPNADGACARPILSADGRYLTFISVARNLIANTALLPASGRAAVYVYDSVSDTISIASLTSAGTALSTGVGTAQTPTLEYDFSKDGNWVFFSSDASNVHPDRSMAINQAFFWTYRRNLHNGQVDIVSKTAMNAYTSGNMTTPRCDATGNRVLFAGSFIGVFGGPALVPGTPASFNSDLYLKDMTTGEVILISKTRDGTANDGAFGAFEINGNGTVVAFGSTGNKYVQADSDSMQSGDSFDIFRADIDGSSQVTITQSTVAVFGTDNVGYFSGPYLPGTGDYVAFNSRYFMRLLGEPDRAGVIQGIGVGAFNFQSGGPSYDTWGAGLPVDERGLDQRPTSSSSNLEKFIYGADASSTMLDHLPVAGMATGESLGLTSDTNLYLTLTVRVLRSLPSGFNWSAKVASTITALGGSVETPVQVGAPTPDGDVDVYQFRLPTPINGNQQGFLGVRLEGAFNTGG